MKITFDKKSEDYKSVKRANTTYLFCILFEVVGIMTMLFWGTIGAQMAIYFLTFAFAFFVTKKNEIEIPIHPIKKEDGKTILLAIGTTICGISVAMLLNAFAGILTRAGEQTAEDINSYPVWLALIVFAIVPAIVEEYVFRGVILEEYQVLGTKEAILMSSIFFALLHFSLGSVLYGFFFGCVFALTRLSTKNLLVTMIMHMTFNGLNVLLSYANLEMIPGWILVASIVIGVIGFVILFFLLLARNPVLIEKGRYKKRCVLTKEGYISVAICLTIMVLLLMM